MARARSSLVRSTHPIAAFAMLLALLALCAACQRSVAVAPDPQLAGDSLAAADSSGKSDADQRQGRLDANRAEASEWRGRPTARVEELLAGRFPGVHVHQTANGFSVRMRGPTSFHGGNEPLYIVDGFPIEPGPGGLVAINPDDVASIEVLKDAASQAAYGLRGANGVVIIKTKRGP
jgi:TonB-dependent SusC/RagA subfamily outer membrane receptor